MGTPTSGSLVKRSYSFAQAKESLETILDSSERGGLSVIGRPGRTLAVVVNGEKFRQFLAQTIGPNAQVVNQADLWTVCLPGLPFAAEATKLDDALADLIEALREYADDWEDQLHLASNHRENWALTQLVELSSDEQLIAWLTGSQ